MKLKGLLYAGVIAASLGGLAGCDQLGLSSSGVIGNLVIMFGEVPGGLRYHVIFYSSDTVMEPVYNPDLPQPGYDEAPQAVAFQGTFPGISTEFRDTVNFQITDVPAGLYSVFGWVDYDDNGAFDPSQDLWGFYYGNPGLNTLYQPPANVVVPESGLVDLDVWVGYNAG